jgi:CBS domain containing-hemolysin-like protein
MCRSRCRSGLRLAFATLVAAAPAVARAAFLSGETLDTAANVVSWIVLIFVPILVIVVFWIIHVLPEKIAHKRHHPQRAAIQTLCLLSLVFGGLLWPIAWLWAYTRPVGYKLAYGTDKHEDYFAEQQEKLRANQLADEDLHQLKTELDTMRTAGKLPVHLESLHADVARRAAERREAAVAERSA